MKAKNLFIYSMMVLFVTIFSTSVWAEGSENINSNYKISPDQNFTPTTDFQNCWEIAYGESQTPVHVFLKETKKGQEYIVRSKYFEVKYVNGSQGFGAKLVNANETTVNENLNNAVLNQRQLANQQRISQTAIDSSKALEMIANYLPDLINEQYNSILN